MKSIVQIVPSGTNKVDLKETTIFPPKPSAGTARNWNTKSDGSGILYKSGQKEVIVKENMNLYARYPGDIYQIVYYYVDGLIRNEKIQDEFTLEYPINSYPEFKCWKIDNVNRIPSSYYPYYPVEQANRDIEAYMSANYLYLLTYDSGGGIGEMPAISKECKKYVDLLTKKIIVESNKVYLANNLFKKNNGISDAEFIGWKIDGTVKPAFTGLVNLDSNKIAIAKWQFPALYICNVVCNPKNAGTTSVTGLIISNSKTLVVIPRFGYNFLNWTDSLGKVIGNSTTLTVAMEVHSKQDPAYVSNETYTANFSYDSNFTMIIYTDESSTAKDVTILTRSILLGKSTTTANFKAL